MPAKIALRKLMDQVAGASSLQAVYDSALRCLHETLDVERAAVLVLDEQRIMRFTAWSGLSAPYRHAVEGHSPWPVDGSEAAPVLVEDVEQAPGLDALRAAMAHERIRALAFVPLRFGPKLLGKFMLYYEHPHRFSTDEITIAETIAGHVAFALEHHRTAGALAARLEAERATREDAEREARLREEQERRLHLALSAGAMGTWEWDVDAARVQWSEQLEAIHGLEPGGFEGTFEAFQREIHPEDRNRVLSTLERAVDGETSDYEIDYRIVPQDGVMRWVTARGRLLRDEHGLPSRMVGICSDISERKRRQQAEAFLAAASRVLARTLEPDAVIKELARLVVPQIADWCIVFVGDETRVEPVEVAHRDSAKTDLARQMIRRWGVTVDTGALADALTRGRATVTPRLDPELLAAQSRDAQHRALLESLGLHSAITAPLQTRGRVRGAVMLLSSESKRVYGSADLRFVEEIASWAALAIDNADLYGQARRARGAAERARERLQLLARISDDLATSLDPDSALKRLAVQVVPDLADYCITYSCDGSSIRRLGLAHGDPAKLPLLEALAATGSPTLDDATGAGAVIRSGHDTLTEEVTDRVIEEGTLDARHREAVRALRPCSTIIVALRARGTTLGAIALVTTVDSNRRYDSEDFRLARELASRAALLIDNVRLLARANAAVRARDDMMAVVSHDLRSPLQSIATATSLLQLDGSPARRLEALETIELATSQMDRLLADLLDISRIEAGQLTIEAEAADVGSLLREAEALFRPLASDKAVRFGCIVGDRLPSMRVDRGRMLQVLSNLLGNAIKFAHRGGRIELSAKLIDGKLRVAVTDDGIGIEEDDLPRVFDRFWRGAHGYGGTGLGLALAKGIVEAHGGTLSVDSRAGEGSTFAFELEPALLSKLPAARAAAIEPDAQHHPASTRLG